MAGDFISWMTYAQHAGGTTPGPVAGLPWMREMMDWVLDGVTVSQEMMSQRELQHIPIIMVTAKGEEIDTVYAKSRTLSPDVKTEGTSDVLMTLTSGATA